jgi:hypothetical protein
MIASVTATGSRQAQSVHEFRKGGFLQMLDAGAQYLGLTDEQLRDQLQAGNSLAEIAQTQGKSPDELKSALLSAFPQSQKTEQLGAVLDRMMTEHPRVHHGHRGQRGAATQAVEAIPDPAGSPDPGEGDSTTALNLLG